MQIRMIVLAVNTMWKCQKTLISSLARTRFFKIPFYIQWDIYIFSIFFPFELQSFSLQSLPYKYIPIEMNNLISPNRRMLLLIALLKNNRSKNTLFTTLLSFKRSMIGCVFKTSIKEVCTQKDSVMRGTYCFRERKKGKAPASH